LNIIFQTQSPTQKLDRSLTNTNEKIQFLTGAWGVNPVLCTTNIGQKEIFFHCELMSNKLRQSITCESLSPSFSASFFLSGFEMYFCCWNLFSRPFRWKSLNTARRNMPRRGLPAKKPVKTCWNLLKPVKTC